MDRMHPICISSSSLCLHRRSVMLCLILKKTHLTNPGPLWRRISDPYPPDPSPHCWWRREGPATASCNSIFCPPPPRMLILPDPLYLFDPVAPTQNQGASPVCSCLGVVMSRPLCSVPPSGPQVWTVVYRSPAGTLELVLDPHGPARASGAWPRPFPSFDPRAFAPPPGHHC